jgi:hypothetical protein
MCNRDGKRHKRNFLLWGLLSVLFWTVTAAPVFADEASEKTSLMENTIKIPVGLEKTGLNLNKDDALPYGGVFTRAHLEHPVIFLRYDLPKKLEFIPHGFRYKMTVDGNGDHEIAQRVRLVNTGETYAGTTNWKTEAAIEGRVRMSDLFALAYQAENSRALNPSITDQDLTGGALSGIISLGDRVSLTGGGCFETLTNYFSKTNAGYYNLQLAYYTPGADFTLEGLWASADGFVNMRDMTTSLGAQTFSGVVSIRF